MKLRVLVVSWFFFLFLSGCASTALDRYRATPPTVPVSSYVKTVPFISQPRYPCGPASLAMVLHWAGKEVSEESLAEKTFTPKKEGTFQVDILGAARREGFLAIPITGYSALFSELA